MSSYKRRKISGLSGIELAIQALCSVKNAEMPVVSEDVDADGAQTSGESAQDEKDRLFEEHLDGMIHLMKSMLEEPQVRWT